MAARELWLRDDIRLLWQNQDPFAAAFAQPGETFRALEQRQTLAFSAQGRRYFIKRHRGATWTEILKNLMQLRLPVVSSGNEYRAISKLQALGIRAPRIAAYGKRGITPGTFESFLVTEDVGPHQSLEDYCRKWPQQAPAYREKTALLEQVADIARTMHHAGICHRDFYICHLLRTDDNSPLTVIDLHRALIKRKLGRRWVIKDVAGLYYSAMEIGLGRHDIWRFMRRYRGAPLRETLRQDAAFWRAVEERALRMYHKEKNSNR